MDCFSCKLRLSTGRVPRVLIDCGHTICEDCLFNHYIVDSIRCPECQQLNFGPLDHFPKNLTLLNLQPVGGCSVHHKPFEGFCEKDKELLCVTCILEDKHRTHKISSIQQTVAKDKEILEASSHKIKISIRNLEDALHKIQQALQNSEVSFTSVNSQIEVFYNKLAMLVHSKEHQAKEKLKTIFEGFNCKMSDASKEAEERIEFLRDLQKMYQETMLLRDIDYLNQIYKRVFIVENSQAKHSKVDLQPPPLLFNKNDEIRKVLITLQEQLEADTRKPQGRLKKPLPNRNESRKEGVLVLELDLNDKYRKHQETKYRKKAEVNESARQQEDDDVLSEIRVKSSQSSCLNRSLNDLFKRDITLSVKDYEFSLKELDEKVYILGGANTTRAEAFDCNTGESSNLGFMLERSRFQAIAISKEEILVIGGNKIDNSIVYNTSRVSSFPVDFKLNPPRSGFAALPTEDKLYIIGGSDSKTNFNLVEEYSLRNLSIRPKRLPNIIFPRTDFGAAVGFDGRIYLVGGIGNKDTTLISCERFDFEKRKWELIANMNTPRSHLAVVSLPDGVYAIGGSDGTNPLSSVERFDWVSETWKIICPLSEGRMNLSGCVTSDNEGILVFGGHNSSVLKSIERYSVVGERWSGAGTMLQERYMHQSVVMRTVL